MNEIGENPELDEEVIEEVAEKSAALIVKKILKWTAIVAGFAAVGIGLAKVLAPEDSIYVIEGTGEVFDTLEEALEANDN